MFQFGIGALFANPTGGNLATPSFPQRFGTLQDVTIDIDQKLVELRGQTKAPDDVAPSDFTFKGKAATAQIEIATYNALFFGETIVTGTKQIVDGEAKSVPGTSTYTVTVNGAANFIQDLGVRYANGSGYLTAVTAGSEALGKYSVVQTGGGKGVYTFAAADAAAAVLISYVQSNTAGSTLTVTNRIQGYGPTFEMWLAQPYQNASNGMHFFAARCSKFNAPMKRDGYEIPDFEFTIYANAAGNILEMFQVSA